VRHANVTIFLWITVRPELRHLPPERRTAEGGTLIAACEAVGLPDPTVFWSRDGYDNRLVDGPQPVSSLHFQNVVMAFSRHC
jgi:hypothetical protein